jgi:hypothetical protein
MFKLEIAGLDEIHRELADAQRAMEDVDGELGTVRFDPHDPTSIERAISEVDRMIDERLGRYADNAIIGPMIQEMKESYRGGIIESAAAARLKEDQD